MEIKRKPFQGVSSIIRFNWHLYGLALLLLFGMMVWARYMPVLAQTFIWGFAFCILGSLLISLASSFYIYDLSGFYKLAWLPPLGSKKVLNIHAGFDETSLLILDKNPSCSLTICDFYDSEKHTELAIKRARRIFPPLKGTLSVDTKKLPFPDHSFEIILVTFSAHEIRDRRERIAFFQELHRVLRPQGLMYVTEHLRDINNMIAYTVGAFHFYSKRSWLLLFGASDWVVTEEIKQNPFVKTFILEKNGNTP